MILTAAEVARQWFVVMFLATGGASYINISHPRPVCLGQARLLMQKPMPKAYFKQLGYKFARKEFAATCLPCPLVRDIFINHPPTCFFVKPRMVPKPPLPVRKKV